MHAPLTHWLRLLWGRAPQLAFDSDCAYIDGGAIHLPARPHWQHHTAAAAHAAAHLVYSPPRFDGAGLGPVARVLLALLEDARVESLAVRELPGLARLWRPQHTATPDDGVGFEGLAMRLARSLCDPAYDDPHPWVRKGRALAFLDRALDIPATRTPAELRAVANRLGHDIGQMRLPFNGKAALPLPAYRDDHRWMWAADSVMPAAPPPQLQPIGATPAVPDASHEPPGADAEGTSHPEWDRLIARMRPDWCRVVESVAAEVPAIAIADSSRSAARRLLAPVSDLTRIEARPEASDTGETFDLDALVQWRVCRRLGRAGPTRVYREPRRRPVRPAVWLLIDQSASTAAPASPAHSGLELAARSALALGLALQARGIRFGVASFHSNGRRAVRWQMLKAYSQPADEAMAGRLAALRAEGSTRLGAVLRHATLCLRSEPTGLRWVLLFSDGQPHDIDVHDPAYLPEDARSAVARARRLGVRIACLLFEPEPHRVAARIFGSAGAVPVEGVANLPRALRRLLG